LSNTEQPNRPLGVAHNDSEVVLNTKEPNARVALNTNVVLDTNIVLDMWLFDNPDVVLLRDAVQLRRLTWIASERMFAELPRVLAYPHLEPKLAVHIKGEKTPLIKSLETLDSLDSYRPYSQSALSLHPPYSLPPKTLQEVANSIATCMHHWAKRVETAPACHYKCKDTDDQVFVDLAAQHQATLISKDKAVLKLKNRLARLGSKVLAAKDTGEWLKSQLGTY
jgi:predicted nucleic acid-binding protein